MSTQFIGLYLDLKLHDRRIQFALYLEYIFIFCKKKTRNKKIWLEFIFFEVLKSFFSRKIITQIANVHWICTVLSGVLNVFVHQFLLYKHAGHTYVLCVCVRARAHSYIYISRKYECINSVFVKSQLLWFVWKIEFTVNPKSLEH